MGSMALGPVVLPADMVLLLATVVLALVAAKLLHKRLGADVEPLIWRVLVLSLLATRLGFVLEFAALYADAPLEVLNVRDGGWEPVAGWAAAWAFTAWLAWRRPLQRRALGSVLLVATAVWWGGGWALQQTSGGAPAPRLPDIALTTLELREQPLARFAGQPVVLNLWASWCGPCQREMPTLERAQQRYPG
ncbi:MAG: TlpA family protein disulfide reductase, partial [Giesbergeria sp.]|nr:TlpA family protein disulfide reductase [Giesbergeria sp.]